MPIIALKQSIADGIQVRVQVGLSRHEVLRLRTAHQPIPQPVVVTAVIDTGAERSCVDPRVISQAQLPYKGAGFTNAPGVEAGPAIFGGSLLVPAYDAGLVILHPSGNASDHFVIAELPLDELTLATMGIEAVIGRDVLARCVLVYDGPAGGATLAY
ncbi:hypothetical protein [Gemmata sp.]|uniref:hypothetical protein n=1 Tax=Gemmata sp. TaxID=1914242 RepID=UPI003F6E8B87